jgi:hypothetical protein
MRWDYGDPTLGTCKESIEGGNHFRYWAQTGGSADRCVLPCRGMHISMRTFFLLLPLFSGAVFMALSYELPEQCEFFLLGFTVLCSHLTLTFPPKYNTTLFLMGASSHVLAIPIPLRL